MCTYDWGERVRTQLDRLNARERPFAIKPVPYPKPQNPYYPNLLETDDAAVFNFLSQQVEAECRYEFVQSGAAPAYDLGGGIPALAWAARYFYDLIQENDRSADLVARAKVLLGTIATYLQTLQVGFGTSPLSTKANSPFYGAFLASGASTYVTQDASLSGLALLYAYRVLGTGAYLAGARAAASYLRNVQSIGKCAFVYFTSSDAAGLARLYTGALVSEVSTAVGVDPGEIFYSTHLFYAYDIAALEFWSELKTTDGDQTIGATTTISDTFATAPAQLLSESITDLRSCWATGITDATGTLVNGLSSATPREFFNAYPATKPQFPAITGTGMWEFADGDADVGTQITSQNFARALSTLYNYEGATSQVTTISDWLRTFESNEEFETPEDISTTELYEGTTGTYDPTLTISTLLTVRDADNSYAATAINGSSLYDWGAFGLLSRIWASRNRASFMTSRLYPLNTVQRFFAGNATDVWTDRVALRGLSGLTMQTGFLTNTLGTSAGNQAYSRGSTVGSAPPGIGTSLVLWLNGSRSWNVSGGLITSATDVSGYGQNFSTDATFEPYANLATIDGVPCMTGGFNEGKYLIRTAGLRARDGSFIGYGNSDTQTKTIMVVMRPKTGVFSITGGPVFNILGNRQPQFIGLFDLESTFTANGFYVMSKNWRSGSASDTVRAPNTAGGTYHDTVVLAEWRTDTFPDLEVAINGQDQTLTPSTIPGSLGAGTSPTMIFGNYDTVGFGLNFYTDIAEGIVWDRKLTGQELIQARQYFANRYSSLGMEGVNLAMVNDAVRAAQFGRSFREARS